MLASTLLKLSERGGAGEVAPTASEAGTVSGNGKGKDSDDQRKRKSSTKGHNTIGATTQVTASEFHSAIVDGEGETDDADAGFGEL
jgi:hypothetical protein